MENTKFLIIGAGMAGMIVGFYLREEKDGDFLIVGDNRQSTITRSLGPSYLHADHNSKDLLERLGFDLKTRIINCAVMTEKGLSEDFTSEVVKKYNRKVRGTEDEKGMNDGKSSFEIFTPSFKIIKATLDYILDENKVVDNVVSIDLDSRKVKGRGGTYKYEKLISTIPLPEFEKLSKFFLSRNLKWKRIWIAHERCEDLGIWKNKYDFIYDIREDVPYYRITKVFYPWVTLESVQKINGGHKVEYGKIIGGRGMSEILSGEVKFFGRYSQWVSNMKINDLIGEVRKWVRIGWKRCLTYKRDFQEIS